jgi:hypothetical protein
MKRVIPLLVLVWISGCAKYEFELTQPDNLRTHIGRKEDALVRVDPLQYRMISYEGRLILRIYNPTHDPIQLLGAQSAVVDPGGQAHPMPTLTIAPESFIKLILPPPAATVERMGPSVGYGVGYTRVYGYRREFGYSAYYYDEPRYYTVQDPANPYFWDWSGETDVRLTLVYDRAGRQFRDEFMFHRVKV